MTLRTPLVRISGKIRQLPAGDIVNPEYVSPEQVITNAGLLTLTHLLGEKPRAIRLALVCKVAEHGITVGEELELLAGGFTIPGAGNFFVSVRSSAENIQVRFAGSGIQIINETAGGVTITNARWRVVVRAWV